MSNKKIKYVSQKDIRKCSGRYVIVLGERSNGKSYAVKGTVLEDYLKNGTQFVYLRRYEMDTKDSLCVSYFGDVPVYEITGGKYSHIDVFRKGIYLANLNEDGKVVRGEKIGYCHCLSGSEHYKSLAFPEVGNIIYEEFISQTGQYLNSESTLLQNYVSTIMRHRTGKVYLIGNKLSRICPYYKDWKLNGVLRLPEGKIEDYNLDDGEGSSTVVTVFHTKSVQFNSGMFFGKAAKSITRGAYESQEQPHLPDKIYNYKVIHRVVLRYEALSFLMSLLVHKNTQEMTWYVEPKTTEVQKGTRLICKDFSTNPLQSFFLEGLTDQEERTFRLLKDGRVCFSDDLTGTEFNNVLPHF